VLNLHVLGLTNREIAEIHSDAVLRGVYVPPSQVGIAVEHGAVTLTGEGKAELLNQFVREVTGVVSVDSQLSWRSDKPAPTGIRGAS
jgi:hypothetical protein